MKKVAGSGLKAVAAIESVSFISHYIMACHTHVTLYLDSRPCRKEFHKGEANCADNEYRLSFAALGKVIGGTIMGVAFAPRLPTPETSPALVLNADYRPLSYYPLSIWNWQTALKAVFLRRVDIVSTYDTIVHSPSMEMNLPSVIALKKYIRQPEYPAFTRFNLFLRDQFSCQYCGSLDELTFDHVIPRSQGGQTSWTNITAACSPCNLKKGGRTPKQSQMHPRRFPYRPTTHELNANGRLFPPNYLHESWRDYLYWDAELET